MLRYAIIGFGGLGKIHCHNLLKLEKERGDIQLCAIANSDLSTLTSVTKLNIGDVQTLDIDFSKYNLYTDYKELIDTEHPDFVVTALPTYLHAEVACYALSHGCHVYSEKPMAINAEQCRLMEETATKYNKKLMIGQCMRFAKELITCREIIESGKYGKVIRAEFIKKSPLPTWSYKNWLLDVSKSGGVLVDMHVHDADLINWLFGLPKRVFTRSTDNLAELESVYSILEYDDKIINVVTDWGLPATFKFREEFSIALESALLQFEDSKLMLYTNEGAERLPVPEDINYTYYDEMAEFADCLASDTELRTVPLSSVSDSMKIVFAELESVNKNTYIDVK